MKKIIHKEVCEITLRTFRFLLMFIIITLNHNHVKAGGNINSTSGYLMLDSVYYNNVTEVWTINTGVNKPVKFDFWIDVENYADFVHIYAVDMFGNDFHVGSFTGSSCCNSISTNFPSGKAKIVFKTDELICGTDGYDGAWIHFYADNSYSGVVNENVFINNQSLVNGNSMVSGKLGVGTLQPSKRFEVWDGSSTRFTFSANSSTSGYEVAHTLDNIGYKINVGSSIRNYKVSVNGIDKLKILSNENYGLV